MGSTRLSYLLFPFDLLLPLGAPCLLVEKLIRLQVGLGPPPFSQASGADTGAADAAHSLPNPRAEAHDSEASAIAFGSSVNRLLIRL